MGTEIKTGVGRIVWGNPAKPQIKKDVQTKQPVLRDGQQVQQWVFGVAFPKAEFEQMIWPAMAKESAQGYPNGAPQHFAWKYNDGDGVDSNGQPFNSREGYAGHYVLTISTEAFAPPVYKLVNGAYVQLQPDQIKTGDYVVLALNIVVNVPTNRTHTPGLYINPVAIDHVGYGQEIHNGPDAQQLFGGSQYQLPAGASQTPVASGGAGMPGTGQQPPMGQQPPQQPPMGQPAPQQPPMGQPAPQQPPMGQPAPQQPPMGQQPPQQPPMGQPAPQQPPMGQPGTMPPPANDFVQNAGNQVMPGQQPPAQNTGQPAMPGNMQPGMHNPNG